MPRSPKIGQLRSSCDLLDDLLKYLIRRSEADRAFDLDLQNCRAASPVVRVDGYIVEGVTGSIARSNAFSGNVVQLAPMSLLRITALGSSL